MWSDITEFDATDITISYYIYFDAVLLLFNYFIINSLIFLFFERRGVNRTPRISFHQHLNALSQFS